jgi:hypothetical protein
LPKKQRIYDYFYEFASALHIVIFENFVKSMTSCLSKLEVTPSFCFAFKIPNDVTANNIYFSIQDQNKAMEAAQQQKAAAAANGGRAASGQPQMRDSPNDNRGGKFFTMSMEFDRNIST